MHCLLSVLATLSANMLRKPLANLRRIGRICWYVSRRFEAWNGARQTFKCSSTVAIQYSGIIARRDGCNSDTPAYAAPGRGALSAHRVPGSQLFQAGDRDPR